jgi:dephospho-CoA kinase
MDKPWLIGISGLPRSGKDVLAELLIADNWFGISLGDVVRGYARDRHKTEPDPISVANMTETANWLRENNGPDVILQVALRQFKKRQVSGKQAKGLVLWSVRMPVEVDFILSHGGQLFWVDASDNVRYQRAMNNLRPGEQNLSLTEFKRQEDLQWLPQPGIAAEIQMNIAYVKSHATKIIVNNGSDKDAFIKRILKLIRQSI